MPHPTGEVANPLVTDAAEGVLLCQRTPVARQCTHKPSATEVISPECERSQGAADGRAPAVVRLRVLVCAGEALIVHRHVDKLDQSA